MTAGDDREAADVDSNDFLRVIWSIKPCVAAGGYTFRLRWRRLILGVALFPLDAIAFLM